MDPLAQRERAIEIATAEVQTRQWGVTQQFLAVHEVSLDQSGQPQIAHVDMARGQGAFYVYFPVQGQSYFLVIVIRPDKSEDLAVSAVYHEARTRAYLVIASKSLVADEISKRIGLSPTRSSAIGDPISAGTRTHDEHLWILEPRAGIPDAVERKLEGLLECVEPVASRIAALGLACDVRIDVIFDGWAGDPQFGGFHFEKSVIQRLAALGVELGFDLYAMGPRMLENDDSESRSS